MKKYFYTDGINNFGPFTIQELKEKGITRETPVWFQELGEWKNAGMVHELNELFAFIPNQPQSQYNSYQQPIKKNKSILDMIIFLSIAFWFTTNIGFYLMQKVVDNWWAPPYIYIQIASNLVFAFIPIIFALTVKSKTLKIISIALGAILTIRILAENIRWLIESIF